MTWWHNVILIRGTVTDSTPEQRQEGRELFEDLITRLEEIVGEDKYKAINVNIDAPAFDEL